MNGCDRRRGDLYGTRSVFSYARKMAKTFKGIENVYTQHAPLLSETLRLLTSNDLSSRDYPYASQSGVLRSILTEQQPLHDVP